QNIPRDPGTTLGLNIGIGIARTTKSTTIGVDLIQEPMVSNTWGIADRDTAVGGGGGLRAGGRTGGNHFKFSNTRFRAGVSHDFVHTDSGNSFGLQFGLAVYAINYKLSQVNHVRRIERWLYEGWTERTPTFGLRWRTQDFDLHYSMRF